MDSWDGLDRAVWKKSSRSTYSGNCVETAEFPDGIIGMRDTKQSELPGRPVLRFTRSAWHSFVLGVRAGEFDYKQQL